MTTERPELHILPFSVIRDTLDRLLVAMINRLDRDCPKGITQFPGAQPFFLVAIEAAKNCYDAIRWLTSDIPKDQSPPLDLCFATPPLVRMLADLLFTVVFLGEDLPKRVVWYHKSGWRELKEECGRYHKEYGASADWQDWLKSYAAGVEVAQLKWGISQEEAQDPKLVKWWPIPGQMLKVESGLREDRRSFLQYVYDWVYKNLSASAHLSAAGLVRNAGFLILPRDERREEILTKLKSDSVFTAITLVLAICTEVNALGQFERDEPIKYLWGILTGYSDEAQALYRRRYTALLSA
jgi:hypothetical protein